MFGKVCGKVSRNVCQPLCKDTDYCKSCSLFVASGGFQQCANVALNCKNSTVPWFIIGS